MSSLAIARRYARAVALLARPQGSLAAVTRDVAAFAQACRQAPGLAATLESPAFSLAERNKVLQTVLVRLGAQPMARNFLALVLEKGRIGAISGIATELIAIDDESVGRARAEVRSATPLDAVTVLELQAQLRTATGAREVVLQQQVDPSLIGGVVARVGDRVYDGSLRTQLQRLRLYLTQRELAQA